MMAHVNSSGTHIPLWMDSPDASVGWGTVALVPDARGHLLRPDHGDERRQQPGRVLLQRPRRRPERRPGPPGRDRAPCRTRTPGRSRPASTASATRTTSTGTTSITASVRTANGGDGDTSCTLNGVTYNHPITVWRGVTYQAETAEGGGFTSGVWTPGAQLASTRATADPGARGCAIIADAKNGMGKRVGYIGGGKGVRFTNVNVAASGRPTSSSTTRTATTTPRPATCSSSSTAARPRSGRSAACATGATRAAPPSPVGVQPGTNNTVTSRPTRPTRRPTSTGSRSSNSAASTSPRRASASRRCGPSTTNVSGAAESRSTRSTATWRPLDHGPQDGGRRLPPDRLQGHGQPEHHHAEQHADLAAATTPAPWRSTRRRTARASAATRSPPPRARGQDGHLVRPGERPRRSASR